MTEYNFKNVSIKEEAYNRFRILAATLNKNNTDTLTALLDEYARSQAKEPNRMEWMNTKRELHNG